MAAATAAMAEEKWTAGFRLLKEGEFPAAVWYPSEQAESTGRMGPYDFSRAADAAAAGKFPLIIFSHGWTGRFRNHHLTARFLARRGFVVAMPQHRDRLWQAMDINTRMHWRVADVHEMIALLRADDALRGAVDFENINAGGYSLGGATALLAAGASLDLKALIRHCRANGEEDPEVCAPSFLRTLARIYLGWFPVVAEDGWPPPLRFNKIFLIAPLGQAMNEESLAELESDILIVRMTDDAVLRYPYHAAHLRKILSNAAYREMKAQHYAFIAPPAPRVPRDEYWPEVTDPEGFDRAALIDEINAEILAHLAAAE